VRLKSFIITIVALFVLANVIVAAMRRCGVVPDAANVPDDAHPVAAGASPTSPLETPLTPESAAAVLSSAPLPTVARPPAGIEGLHLQLSRPLMFDIGALGGLAAEGEHLYVAAWDDGAGAAVLYQVDRAAYGIAQVRALAEEGAISVGGIDVSGGLVWVPLTRGGDSAGTLILGVDAQTLEVRERREAARDIAAVAAGGDGSLYGVTRDGALWLVWPSDDGPAREAAAVGGARYTDLAEAGGSLVAVGTDGVSGVVDVIDPQGFTLLARHHSVAEGADGAWVTSGGLEVTDEAVLLLPEGGARPSLLTYVPEAGDLDAFAPSVEVGK